MLAMHEVMLAYESTPGAADGSVGQLVARSEHPSVWDRQGFEYQVVEYSSTHEY